MASFWLCIDFFDMSILLFNFIEFFIKFSSLNSTQLTFESGHPRLHFYFEIGLNNTSMIHMLEIFLVILNLWCFLWLPEFHSRNEFLLLNDVYTAVFHYPESFHRLYSASWTSWIPFSNLFLSFWFLSLSLMEQIMGDASLPFQCAREMNERRFNPNFSDEYSLRLSSPNVWDHTPS